MARAHGLVNREDWSQKHDALDGIATSMLTGFVAAGYLRDFIDLTSSRLGS